MPDLESDISAIYRGYRPQDALAWTSGSCPACGDRQFYVLARTANDAALWMRCASCARPLVRYYGEDSPGSRPFGVPDGLDAPSALLWAEVRDCFSVNAYTASVMLNRKLLFHMAVAKGLPPKNQRDRAPDFSECLDFLQEQGFTTPQMRPWVDRIRAIGNDANHEVPQVSAEQAMDVAQFTEQLLRHVFEYPLRIPGAAST